MAMNPEVKAGLRRAMAQEQLLMAKPFGPKRRLVAMDNARAQVMRLMSLARGRVARGDMRGARALHAKAVTQGAPAEFSVAMDIYSGSYGHGLGGLGDPTGTTGERVEAGFATANTWLTNVNQFYSNVRDTVSGKKPASAAPPPAPARTGFDPLTAAIAVGGGLAVLFILSRK